MCDQASWLEEWCPRCRAAPGARCRRSTYWTRRPDPSAHLHHARGWRQRPCPKCKAQPGEVCRTPSGRAAAIVHAPRLSPARYELATPDLVWAELERRGAGIAVVPFDGRAGVGGHAETITLSRLQDGELVDVERWTGRDELAHALEAPVWGRYGSLVGQPPIDGAVIWTTQDRRVGLKRLAREMKCPVIAVAQLSRAVEQRPDKGPVLSDLREPGQIEANADCVMMLYRDDYYDRDSERPGEMDVIVRKNRQGRVGQLTTRIDGRLRYLPVARDEPS